MVILKQGRIFRYSSGKKWREAWMILEAEETDDSNWGPRLSLYKDARCKKAVHTIELLSAASSMRFRQSALIYGDPKRQKDRRICDENLIAISLTPDKVKVLWLCAYSVFELRKWLTTIARSLQGTVQAPSRRDSGVPEEEVPEPQPLSRARRCESLNDLLEAEVRRHRTDWAAYWWDLSNQDKETDNSANHEPMIAQSTNQDTSASTPDDELVVIAAASIANTESSGGEMENAVNHNDTSSQEQANQHSASPDNKQADVQLINESEKADTEPQLSGSSITPVAVIEGDQVIKPLHTEQKTVPRETKQTDKESTADPQAASSSSSSSDEERAPVACALKEGSTSPPPKPPRQIELEPQTLTEETAPETTVKETVSPSGNEPHAQQQLQSEEPCENLQSKITQQEPNETPKTSFEGTIPEPANQPDPEAAKIALKEPVSPLLETKNDPGEQNAAETEVLPITATTEPTSLTAEPNLAETKSDNDTNIMGATDDKPVESAEICSERPKEVDGTTTFISEPKVVDGAIKHVSPVSRKSSSSSSSSSCSSSDEGKQKA